MQSPTEPDPGAPGSGSGSEPPRGPLDEEHWSRARSEMNQEALDYYRERSKAPGVAEGGASRNHYCLECNGVLPLSYEQRKPAEEAVEHCPHCGASLEGRVRAMFNWVETDQVPPSDVAALLVPAAIASLSLVGVALILFFLLR